MSLFRPLAFKFAQLFPNEIRISIHRYLGGVEQHLLAVQPGATLLDMKRYMNHILHCYEDEQTYVLGPHHPVELEDDLVLHDLRMGQREVIVLVRPAPVEHIPLAFEYVVNGNHGPCVCLVLENLNDAHMEHLLSWLENEAAHIQCIDVSATHSRVNEILSMIKKALPRLPLLNMINLRRTAFILSAVGHDALVTLCMACAVKPVKQRVLIRMEAYVFHNSKKIYGDHVLRDRARGSAALGSAALGSTC